MKILNIIGLLKKYLMTSKGQFTGVVSILRKNKSHVYCTGIMDSRYICTKADSDSNKIIKLFHNYNLLPVGDMIEIDGCLYNEVKIISSRHIQIPEWLRLRKIEELLDKVSGDLHESVFGIEGISSRKRLKSVCNPNFPQMLP